MRRSLNFFPLALPFLVALAVLAAVLLVLLEIGAIGYAYERMGVAHEYVFSVLVLSLVGSYVNVPVWEFPEERIVSGHEVRVFGIRYVVPTVEHWPGTVIAVNLGGAIVPTLLALYLIAKNGIYLEALLGVSAVAAAVHRIARPIAGVGIGVPALLPPLFAAVFAGLISPHAAPPLAYASGTLGTLIGADLLNLRKVRGLGAPVASIGGAGTFDGIFLTGILAVLLA
jgi:uncharacterized membrane protein